MTVVAQDKSLQIEKLVLGPYGNNTYFVTCRKTKASALIDAPAEAATILKQLDGTKPEYILLTHNHIDHIGALAEVHARLKIPLAAHASDSGNLPVKPEILLNDGDILTVGELKLEVLHTPGHTPGSLCFKVGRYLISGDTLFAGGPGRTRTPSDLKHILASLTEKIFPLPDDTPVFPGHGDSTTIKKEREEFKIFSSRPHNPNLCGDIVWLTS
ncbi:MAG TPA: MBL fold metallo-hydrolase [Dehalococcoidales bacterium]|nr:MBL fold metallo-hydrolase [Dehalococcoidales bacterium]